MEFADKYEQEMYEKIINGIKLTKGELCELTEFEVDEIKGSDRRWTRSIKTICQLGNRYFALEWEQGLTENQENQFDNQPYEVELKEEVITKTIKKWNRV